MAERSMSPTPLDQLPPSQADALDAALESHLTCLDRYTIMRAELSKHLAAGYISLAEANFASRNSARYGQDHYDGRMHATLLLSVNVDEQSAVSSFSRIEQVLEGTAQDPAPAEVDAATKISQASPSVEAGPDPSPTVLAAPRDPIRQFGLLTPQALRRAQASFRQAAIAIVAVANLERELASIERTVTAIRAEQT